MILGDLTIIREAPAALACVVAWIQRTSRDFAPWIPLTGVAVGYLGDLRVQFHFTSNSPPSCTPSAQLRWVAGTFIEGPFTQTLSDTLIACGFARGFMGKIPSRAIFAALAYARTAWYVNKRKNRKILPSETV